MIQAALEKVLATLLGLGLGLAILWGSAVLFRSLRALWQRLRHQASRPSASPAAPVAATIEPGALSPQLHALDAQFAPFANNSAHPRELAEQPAFKQAAALLADPAVPLETVMQYAQGVTWTLACAAFAGLQRRPDRDRVIDRAVAHFDKLAPWAMYFALDYFLSAEPRPPVGAVVVGVKEWWRDSPIVPLLIADYFARSAAVGDAADFGDTLPSPSASPAAAIRGFLERVNHPMARELIAMLDTIERSNIDRPFLTSFGRFWTDQNGADFLIEPADWRQPLAAAETTLIQPPARSLLVSGERLVGKTSFLRLVAERVTAAGWCVFEASGADLMAGQQWFGQLEGRIRQTIDQLTPDKKVIWYIPDLLALARSGTHQGQSASILDQILPAVVDGRLVVWTEATPTSVARLLQIRPSLRGIFEVVALEPQSEQATLALAHEVVQRLSDHAELEIDPECADVAVASARQYLSAVSFPGAALQILKLATIRSERKDGKVAADDVLKTLSQLTGLPISILDTKERIDLASIRGFFESRVIGQDEAVSSVVERIAMLKAGLNDPDRPIGVFLFAGPTGTGKTELAKTAAEFLFGSVDRMIRLDMSEFQTPESTANILGSAVAGEADSLIARVRKQPFSVVLLDEFEKAHPRVWDLFLQVFDDARLTDTVGQVADFRHCLIIMTTNLGATSHQSMGLGFAPSTDVFTTEQIMRAISQTYRPEFQNRIDKIIVFRPLTRELMRVILKKELSAVLERRGLKDRAWAVEWESSALEFLLEKGFSPEMGARPLKRAIEQYVIAPLAATIVERRFPEGDQFVFVRSDGRSIQAEFVDPDDDDDGAVAAAPQADSRKPTLAAMILVPDGTDAEFDALTDKIAGAERSLASTEWEGLKRSLADEMSSVEFWQRPERFEKLARLALMDRVKAAADTADSLRVRLAKGTGQAGHYSRELISRLALQVHLVSEGIRDAFERSAIEVAILIEPALDTGSGDSRATDAWCRQMLGMYRDWGENRHMQMSEVKGTGELPILLVTGFGAHRVLARECGLHILELTDSNGAASRATARVRLAVVPLGDIPAAKLPRAIIEALDKAPRPSAVVRRYRGEPAPLVRSADGTWRTGKLDAVLRGDFDLLAEGA